LLRRAVFFTSTRARSGVLLSDQKAPDMGFYILLFSIQNNKSCILFSYFYFL